MDNSVYFTCFLDRRSRLNVGIRSLLAIAGGYGVAWLAAASLAVGLPMSRVDATAAAIMLAFVVHIVVAIWVFAAATVTRAVVGTAISALVFGCWRYVQQGAL